jgi:peptide/nickel transport system substrate-binding protein
MKEKMSTEMERLDMVRVRSNQVQNHVIDEFLAGRVTRREFLRAGSLLGIGFVAGVAPLKVVAATSTLLSEGTIRIGHPAPGGAVDPVTAFDVASPALLNQTGEYLLNADSQNMGVTPSLATAWSSNVKGDVWTFKLRTGVKFHNDRVMTANDVAVTFDRLTDPNVGSAALAVMRGVLSKGGTKVVDDHTVQFHLDSPNGAFPYYVSSDTVNAVILPADYAGGYEKSFIGTGPYKLEKYQPKVGAVFTRNPDYWGTKAVMQRVEFKFYGDQQGQLLAMEGGEVDILSRFTVHGGAAIARNPEFKILGTRSSTHRQIHMHTDNGPFKDKRVRQALAMTLDRNAIVRGFLQGRAVEGNDNPFAPVFASSDLSVGQRGKDVQAARKLLADAGVPHGFAATLTTEAFLEMPDLAVIIQNAAKTVGIDLSLKIEPQEAYYGAGRAGKSDWLDSPLGMTDYGHRGVPDAFLRGPLVSGGAWNAAHFSNAQYDRLVASYTASLDIREQKRVAGDIERLLLDETPVIIPYFSDSLIAMSAKVTGVRFTAMAQLYVDQARVWGA